MNESLRVRATWFEKPRTFQIVDDSLVVTTSLKPGEPASPTATQSIALRDIEEVRISHYPARFETNRFRCRLKIRNGAALTFNNAVWEGPVSEANVSTEYRAFVIALCRGVALANPTARFLRGRPRSAMLVENGFLLVLFLVMIAVFAFLKTTMHWFQILQVVLIVIYFPLAVMSYRRNRPGVFNPLQPPDEVLPK